jgi:phosphoglycerate kinase
MAHAKELLQEAQKWNVELIVPDDVMMGKADDENNNSIFYKVGDIPAGEPRAILDIGSETKARYGALIASARTIIWSGPVGYMENPLYRQGTDFIYYSIAYSSDALSIVGGGDTLAAISNKDYLNKITHISTGGGAMLEYIEKGTLPGIEALTQ